MSLCHHVASAVRRAALFAALAICWGALVNSARGQFVTQQVGGVSIDAQGIVTNVKVDELNELKRVRQQALEPVPADLKVGALRKISLRGLEAAIAECRKIGQPLTDEMRYLAGLQRIQYVFVYPESSDIVLAGPGEGWMLSPSGEIVGNSTHRAVMLLDDLLVAMRSIEAAQQTGITCSIDPTAEGLVRLQSMLKQVQAVGNDPNPLMDAMERSIGPQTISVRGVPDTSHFARVLVAADYRMKRIAMAFEESPVRGLPNFLQMMKSASRGQRSMMPRWWLEPNYDALVKDPEGLAWELPAGSVKALTEEEYMAAGGQRVRSAHANPLAKKWADNMTAHYEELSAKDPIFGQLRNCMDLAVVAALISRERLPEKCGWNMALLMDADLPVESYNAPRQVDSRASTLQKGDDWILSVSGGVLMAPWQMLEHATSNAALHDTREKSAAPGASWWWN